MAIASCAQGRMPAHAGHRVVLTAPRPTWPRGGDGDLASCSASVGSDPDDDAIHRNLFAPPTVVQNEIFRRTAVAPHDPARHQVYRPSGCRHPSHVAGPRAPLPATPPGRRPAGRFATCSKVTRTGNDRHCGLSAEISRAVAQRTPMRTPAKTPAKTPLSTSTSRGIAPLSRDLFRVHLSSAREDPAERHGHGPGGIQLTQTASMSSHGSDGGAAPHDFPFMPADDGPPAPAPPKKKPVTFLGTPAAQRKPGKAARKTPFAGLSAGKMSARKKLKNCLTPPRGAFGGRARRRSSRKVGAGEGMTLCTAYRGMDDYRPTSSEQEPSPFQVEHPAKGEMAAHARVCALMDGYTAVHRDFNFAMLSGVSHATLRREVQRSTADKPMIAGACHRDVVQTLLACAEDVVVEGFFREYTEEDNERESERMEACILSSESLRQIIVCFRGSTANQAKPLGKNGLFGKQASCILHEDQKVPVLAAFRTAYFGTPLEKTVFALLANLATRKPFFDVVMTGHSFGAAIATISGLRYASSNSQIRVSCHVFGSPRIGGEEWRQLVHSVPNLRVYRAENGSDPFVLLPGGSEWTHCGHAVQMVESGDAVEFKARRFDRDHSSTASWIVTSSVNHNLLGFVQGKSSQGKVDHEIQSYEKKFTSSGDKWFVDFCELQGSGIRANSERRVLA